jgi:hypothetical protein
MREGSRAGTLTFVCSDLQGDIAMGSLGKTLIATALATGVVAGPAAAATMQAVFTGTATIVEDRTNIFGGPGQQLFTLTYVYDTSLGTRTTTASDDRLENITPGSSNPTISATLQIGGVSRSFTGLQSVYQTCSSPSCDPGVYGWQTSDTFSVSNVVTINQAVINVGDGSDTLPKNLETPFAFDLVNSNIGFTQGQFQFVTQDQDTFDFLEYSAGTLGPAQVTVTKLGDVDPPDPSVVPLPASGILLLGAGAALGALRRRKTRA